MIKTGEIYNLNWGKQSVDDEGFLQGHSARPRAIMNPCKDGFGIMQALQKEFFPLLKEHVPGFIHSMTGADTVEHLKTKVQSNWKAISLDGSAFDSS